MSKRKWELNTTAISTPDDVAKMSALYSDIATAKVKEDLQNSNLEMAEDVSLVVQQATWEAMQDLCNGNMAAQQIRDRLLGLGFVHMSHRNKWRFYDKAMQICIAAKSLGKYESLEEMVVPFHPKVIQSEAVKLQWEESITPEDLIQNWNKLTQWNIKKTEPMRTYVVETEKEYGKAMTDFTNNNAITAYCEQELIPVKFKSTKDLWSQFYKTVYRVWVVLGSDCSRTQMFQNVTSLFKDELHDTKDCQSLVEKCVQAKGVYLRLKKLRDEEIQPMKNCLFETKHPKNVNSAREKIVALMKWADMESFSEILNRGVTVRSEKEACLDWLLEWFHSYDLTEEHQSILRLVEVEDDDYPHAADWCLSLLDVWKAVKTKEEIAKDHFAELLKRGELLCLSCKKALQHSPKPATCAFHPTRKHMMEPWIHNNRSCRATIENEGGTACCKNAAKEKIICCAKGAMCT